jgi:hypothetical protein
VAGEHSGTGVEEKYSHRGRDLFGKLLFSEFGILMEKEQKKTYILNCKQEAEDSLQGRREAWRELWDLYQNKQDYSNKKGWQSRCFVPRVYMTIEQASSVVKRAVMSSKSLYGIESKDDSKIPSEMAGVIDDEFRCVLEDSNFAEVYGEQIKPAFLLGAGAVKVYWEKGLKFDHVEIENLYIDPKFKPSQFDPPKYVIERKTMDFHKFKRMAEKVNKKAKKSIYDMSVLDKIEQDFKDQQEHYDELTRKGMSNYTEVNKRVEILEYWGDVVDDDSGEIQENRLIVLINDQHVIRDQKNPFKHKSPPYILTVPVVYPHRGVAGISLVEPVVKLQYTLNNATNMLLDNLNFSVNKMYEVNVNNVLNPQNLTQLFPGKLVKKNTSNPVTQEVKTTNVGQDAFSAIDMVHKFIEKGTAVTEFVEGSAGKTKTALETQIKTAQSQGWFDTIARDIEKTSLTPLIKMAFSVWIQFSGNKMPQDVMDSLRFKVGGLTIMLRQQEQGQNLSQALAMSMQSPELGQMTETKTLWKKLLDLWGLSDAFTEKPQAPTMDQRLSIEQKAQADAEGAVAQMTPEQQMQTLQQLQGA